MGKVFRENNKKSLGPDRFTAEYNLTFKENTLYTILIIYKIRP